jgi:multiple antibiotic resistance protein
MLHELTKTVLLIVAALFPIINPPASAFIVLSMVPRATEAQLASFARRIAINSFVILLVSLSVGAYLLGFLGISIPVLRVAGGFIIAMAGWKLLQSPDPSDAAGAAGEKGAQAASPAALVGDDTLEGKVFYPLTLPVTIGPGAISVAIALGTGSPREGLQPVHFIGVGLALALLCIFVHALRRAHRPSAWALRHADRDAPVRLCHLLHWCADPVARSVRADQRSASALMGGRRSFAWHRQIEMNTSGMPQTTMHETRLLCAPQGMGLYDLLSNRGAQPHCQHERGARHARGREGQQNV